MQARRATGAPWKYSNVFLDQAELARKELLQVVHGGLEELPSPSVCQGQFRRCQHCLPCAPDLEGRQVQRCLTAQPRGLHALAISETQCLAQTQTRVTRASRQLTA